MQGTWFKSLVWEDYTCCGQLSPRAATTTEPVVQSLLITAADAHTPRARALQQEKPPHCEAWARLLESSPRLLQLDKAIAQQRRPSATKNIYKKKIKSPRSLLTCPFSTSWELLMAGEEQAIPRPCSQMPVEREYWICLLWALSSSNLTLAIVSLAWIPKSGFITSVLYYLLFLYQITPKWLSWCLSISFLCPLSYQLGKGEVFVANMHKYLGLNVKLNMSDLKV